MKTIDRNHTTLNINFTEFTPESLLNLNSDQAAAMAAFFTGISKRMAEAEFLVACYENNQNIPTEIEDTYK